MRGANLALGLLLLGSPLLVSAAETEVDLNNGAMLHKPCALCHGHWSQGIPGGLYPRLAGYPADILYKQMMDYRKGVRDMPPMTIVGRLNTMSEQDMRDLAAYIESIDLDKVAPLNIPTRPGMNIENGKTLYKEDCKYCHGSHGQGKPRKDGPPLTGQYTQYLQKQVHLFKVKRRIHADDPDDETFESYTHREMQDIFAYLSTLDD